MLKKIDSSTPKQTTNSKYILYIYIYVGMPIKMTYFSSVAEKFIY